MAVAAEAATAGGLGSVRPLVCMCVAVLATLRGALGRPGSGLGHWPAGRRFTRNLRVITNCSQQHDHGINIEGILGTETGTEGNKGCGDMTSVIRSWTEQWYFGGRRRVLLNQ